MKARIPSAKEIRDEFNDYVKRNFNLYAERIFMCWAMAMNDDGDDANKISRIAHKAHKYMTAISDRYISWKDMSNTLDDELGIRFVFNNIKFTPVDSKRVLDIIERYKQGYCSANVCIEEIEREVKQ